jgi:hypothetical protein
MKKIHFHLNIKPVNLVYFNVFSFRYSSVASFISTESTRRPQYDKTYMDTILFQKKANIQAKKDFTSIMTLHYCSKKLYMFCHINRSRSNGG